MDKDRSAPREEPESDDEARKGPAESRGLMGGPMASVREGGREVPASRYSYPLRGHPHPPGGG